LHMSPKDEKGNGGGSDSEPPSSGPRPSHPPSAPRNGHELAYEASLLNAFSQGDIKAGLSLSQAWNGLDPVEILRRHAKEDPDFPEVLRTLDMSPLIVAAWDGNWDAYEILGFMKDFNLEAAAEVEKIAHGAGVPRTHLDAKEHLLME